MIRPTLLAAAATLCALPALAFELPPRKAGLWEMNMVFEGRNLPAQLSQHCTDAATDKLMNGSFGGMRSEMCPQQEMKKAGDTLIIDSVCKIGDATTTSHAVVTGDFNSAYTIKVQSRREGGRQMPGVAPGGTSNMTISAVWKGACKGDQQPGDIIMANGMKMNIRDLPQRSLPPRAPPPPR